MHNFTRSLGYDTTGRKRKTKALVNKRKNLKKTGVLKNYLCNNVLYEQSHDIHDKIKNHGMEEVNIVEQRKRATKEEKQEISKQYTIAPAYNKGAYQVIPKDDIKDIGRKG